MLTKFNNDNMDSFVSNVVNSYMSDGYNIDTKDSIIDRNLDKDCISKFVLKKDVDGIECKTVITLSDDGDDKNKSYTYHKIETVGDTKWSEETRTFKSYTDKSNLSSSVNNTDDRNIKIKPSKNQDHFDDDLFDYYHNCINNIFDKFGLGCDWFVDRKPSYKRLDDYIRPSTKSDDKTNTKQKDDHDNDEKEHTKVNTKVQSDKKKVPIESLFEKSSNQKDAYEDDLEDSLIKLVRFIFEK